jgi:hypothetical protein
MNRLNDGGHLRRIRDVRAGFGDPSIAADLVQRRETSLGAIANPDTGGQPLR